MPLNEEERRQTGGYDEKRKNARNNRQKNEKIMVAGHVERQINRYYRKVSRKFMAAGIIVLLLLLVYIVCVTVFFGEYVTYDNLKYLMRDFDAMNIGGQNDFTKIVYNASDSTTAENFRNGLALCDTDKYRYYDASGVLLVEEDLGYLSPVMVPSEKYMLVYDLGGRGYSVFNQLTRIIDRQADGDIIAGNIAPDGSVVLAMHSSETKYVVELYNGAFSKVMSVYKDNYVLDTAVSPDGSTIVICSACPADSDFDCEIDICKRGSRESVRKLTYEHAMPLDAYATENGFAVLCSTEIVFFDKKGENLKETKFTGMSLKYADINEKSAAVVGSTNALGSENRVLVFDMTDKFGEITFDKIYTMRVMGIYASRDTDSSIVYLKLHDTAAAITADGEVKTDDTSGDITTIVPMNTGALVCRKTSANRIFND